ncbi:MAG: peptidoglycan DD-metalloendopeptidase family protein [Halioglobus sp.]|nr:peptidoglycan DD-metalloendopeptidase family protein [Halioglobus sp.]
MTAVPGVATAPVSKVTKPTPVYRDKPPVSSGVYHPGAKPVQAPPIETPPITPAATPPPGVTVLTAEPGVAPVPTAQAPAPAQPQGTEATKTVARAPTPAPAPDLAPAPAQAPAPAKAPTPGAKVTAWRWPAAGSVTRSYSSSVHKGIDIGGSRGDPIYAVADGTVVYAGTGIVGFGELVIVKHNDIYISAYGHNDRLLVKENDVVGAGQVIAEKGSSGTDSVKLHFEIRKEGKPIDPLKVLPRR